MSLVGRGESIQAEVTANRKGPRKILAWQIAGTEIMPF
jgi:hypothetical protein